MPDCVECFREIHRDDGDVCIIRSMSVTWLSIVMSAAVVEPVGRKANWSASSGEAGRVTNVG